MECSRNGSEMLEPKTALDGADHAEGWRQRRTPLSRSFDLRKIDIDQFSLLLAADHKGAAQD